MIRVKKNKNTKATTCYNCSRVIPISPDTVKEKTFDSGVIATYIECPICGERLLKQLDIDQTREKAAKAVKLELLQRKGKKLSQRQKNWLKSTEKWIRNIRLKLNNLYWDEIYQSLNPVDEDQTGMDDQKPDSGNIGVPLRPNNSVERMNEHEISE